MVKATGVSLTFSREVIDISSNGMICEPTVWKKSVPGPITFTVEYLEEDSERIFELLSEKLNGEQHSQHPQDNGEDV